MTNADDGSTIPPGVSVVVKGTTVGTTTDLDGRYSLLVPADAKILQFSFVGMKTIEILIGAENVINVTMQPEVTAIEGVVVTALGISREKKSLGYAVQSVADEDLIRTGNVNLLGALQGKVSGVDIKPSSGMPGASSQLQIRGARSFTGNNTPLYVVDGMPISSTPRHTLPETALLVPIFRTVLLILTLLISKALKCLKDRLLQRFMVFVLPMVW